MRRQAWTTVISCSPCTLGHPNISHLRYIKVVDYTAIWVAVIKLETIFWRIERHSYSRLCTAAVPHKMPKRVLILGWAPAVAHEHQIPSLGYIVLSTWEWRFLCQSCQAQIPFALLHHLALCERRIATCDTKIIHLAPATMKHSAILLLPQRRALWLPLLV